MKTVKITIAREPSGYKNWVFENIKFPITVNAVIAKKGIIKGYAQVLQTELVPHGKELPEHVVGFEDDLSLAILVEPSAFKLV